MKPNCKGVMISFSRNWLYKYVKTIRSRTLFMLLNNEKLVIQIFKNNSFNDFIYVTQQRDRTLV